MAVDVWDRPSIALAAMQQNITASILGAVELDGKGGNALSSSDVESFRQTMCK